MEQLLNKKPSNPEKYLIKILERRQSLLAEKPKTVRFDQWNPRTKTGRSQISEKFDVPIRIRYRIPTVKLKIPEKAFLKSESRTSVI